MKILRKLSLLIPLVVVSCANNSNSNQSSNSSSNSDSGLGSISSNTSATPVTPTTNPQSKNYYQLLVYSFADSNGDGIGDFKGIVDNLDYLVNLGVEGLWLSPILKCKNYHAYDITDYYSINDAYEYGNYDYRYLLNECHNRGISVIMDLVINHTANTHPWVTQHPDWYSGKNVFGDGMRDLDYEKTVVKEEMKNVGKYWLNQGFDGFRLDAAMWLYNYTSYQSDGADHTKNYAYWNEWCTAMRQTKPDCYIIGEVLNSNHDLAYTYANAGFNSTFDFNVRRTVYDAVNGSTDYVESTIANLNKALAINPNYILGRVLSNHDIGRFSQQHGGMPDEGAYYFTNFTDLRLANALNIVMRGNTFVYYGDELGLRGTCPQGYDDMAFRTPMPFTTGRTNSVIYFEGFHGNGQTTSNTLSGHTIEQDIADPNSLYTVVKSLLNIKKTNNAIKNGALAKVNGLPVGLNGYTLADANETVTFVYNATNSPINYTFSGRVLYGTDTVTGTSTSISSKGFIVLTTK